MKRYSKYILPLLLAVQIIGLQFLPYFSPWIEKFYSNGLYPYLSKFFRYLFGWIPFSVGDIIYAVILWFGIRWIIRKRKENWRYTVFAVLNFVSVAYFLFHFLWAFNYYRTPLFEKMHIPREYKEEHLVKFTQKLIAVTNKIQYKITKDTAKKVTNPYNDTALYTNAIAAYSSLTKTHPYFAYEIRSVKKSLFRYPLTYMGFGGYLNPFTNEAQINDLPPKYNLPATTCHEMAHQIGYASESECNFIGFLACTQSEDSYFQYAGYTHALRFCLANIAATNETKANQLLQTIHPGILKNFQESEVFWTNRRTFIDTAFEVFYDNFLKMNQQKDGLESYSKFVDLLVNYYENKKL